jgi:chromosome segregation ATPase
MAIENNKNNSLPSDLNDDSTVNPDTLTVESLLSTDLRDFRRSSDETGDFERTTNVAELTNKTKAELKSEITARGESISRLRFDIQQLRSKWSGLDKEIEAREGLTRKLNRRLSDTQQKLAHAESMQSTREAENDALRANLKDKLSLLTSVKNETKNISETVQSGKFLIDELQQKIARQRSSIRKLKQEIKNFAKRKIEALDALSDKEKQIANLKADVSASTRESACQERDLSGLRNELGVALQEIENLRTSLHGDQASERREGQRRIADQDGLFVRNLQEINALKKQIVRTESYADKIRARLQDVVSSTGNEQKQKCHLEKSLAQMSRQVLELEKQLQEESFVTAELRQENQSIRRKFAEEIRLVRFELGSAEQTLAGQESISEQLASDLIDNQGFRQALESQLECSSAESEKSIRDLSRKMKALQTANEDIERQLENKDNAIAALLSELASRSRTISSTGETENVIHEIDGHMSDRTDEKSSSEKDRMARLLIGNVDGQKLRFPLFKDRLTIGRTAHNDIQLKAHFISRRHAVIVTENGTSRIVDWGSKNGVYVNDTRVAEQTLRNGDLVAIGTAEFRYEERPKR